MKEYDKKINTWPFLYPSGNHPSTECRNGKEVWGYKINLIISFCILRYMLHRLPYPVHTAMYYVLYVVYIYTRFRFQFQNCNDYTCSRGDNSNFIFQTYQNCNNNTVSILILYYSFLHNMSYSITIALELSCIWRVADVN